MRRSNAAAKSAAKKRKAVRHSVLQNSISVKPARDGRARAAVAGEAGALGHLSDAKISSDVLLSVIADRGEGWKCQPASA